MSLVCHVLKALTLGLTASALCCLCMQVPSRGALHRRQEHGGVWQCVELLRSTWWLQVHVCAYIVVRSNTHSFLTNNAPRLWSVLLPRALSVILYVSFLFVVLVVLLNGLIAMMVGTYLSMQTISESSFVYQRCRYIARVEREVHPLFCCWRVSIMWYHVFMHRACTTQSCW